MAFQADDVAFVYRHVHDAFRVSPDGVRAALSMVGGTDVPVTEPIVESPELQRTLERERKRRSNVAMAPPGTPVGTFLTS